MRSKIWLLALVLILAGSLFGQTALTSTTLASAVAVTDDEISVASATGIAAATGNASSGSFLVIGPETVKVMSVSGTVVKVQRGYAGKVYAHPSGAVVYEATAAELASAEPYGACVAGETWPYSPLIVPGSADRWSCNGSVWTKSSDGPSFTPDPGAYVTRRPPLSTDAAVSTTQELATYEFAVPDDLPVSQAMVGQKILSKYTYNGTTAGYNAQFTSSLNYAYLYGDGTLGGALRAQVNYAYQYGGTTVYLKGVQNGGILYGGTATGVYGTTSYTYVWAQGDGNVSATNEFSYWAAPPYVTGSATETATLTNHYGFYNNGAAVIGTNGSLANNYGFYSRPVTGASGNNFNFYSEGATSKNFFEGLVQAGRLDFMNGTEGTCDATTRGETQMVEGGAGVADTVRVCVKDAGDSYAWTTII